MSGVYENLPFARENTYGATLVTDGAHLEGREFIVPDDLHGTGLPVKLRVVRNNSGMALVGKRAVSFAATAGKHDTEVKGYAAVGSERACVLDDHLTSCPNLDLCYVVVEGPVLGRTPLSADESNVMVVGDYLHAMTAVTTGSTTAGRLSAATYGTTGAVVAAAIINIVGRAMSAKTTANTNADVLIHAGRF